jgi:thiamine biosynthesis protein ThiS
MKITLNGKQRDVEQGTVWDLLGQLQLDAGTVVVELNGGVLKRSDFEMARLSEGDSVEVVRFVGGGE